MRERRGRRRILAALLLALLAAGAWWLRTQRPGGVAPGARAAEAPGAPAVSARRMAPAIDPRVAPRGHIGGHVRDASAKPLADVDVCATFSSPDLGSDETRLPRCTKSGADGAYALTELLPARYRVSASAPGRQPASYSDPIHHDDTVVLLAGQAKEGVDLVLEDGGVQVRGVVKDLSGGVVAGAMVLVQPARGQRTLAMARSDGEGRWIAWIAPGEVWASATAESYGTGWASGVEPGRDLEILLTPEAVLVGRVVEAGTNRPVAGAQVSASGDSSGFLTTGDLSSSSGESTFSDAEGRFRIERLSPARYKPVASAPGLVGVARASVLLGLGQTSDEVLVEVHPTATVSGTLLAAGQPCADGSVRLRDSVSRRSAAATTEPGGAIHIRAVLPGHYQVTASCTGFPDDDTLAAVDVAAADVKGVKWELAAGYRVSGRVVDAAGAGVAGAYVSGQTQDAADPRAHRRWAGARTEKDGRFEIEGVAPGTVELQVQVEHHPTPLAPRTVEVHGDVRDVELRLAASGAVEGVVEDEDGQPVGGVTVRARGKTADWATGASASGDDGHFRLDGLLPGDYRLDAEASWTRLRAPGTGDDDVQGVKVSVAVGAVARARLRIEARHAGITGRVLDAAGQPVPDAYVDARRESESAAANPGAARQATRWSFNSVPSLTDTDGRFTVDKLARGKYTVRAYRKGGGEAFAEHVASGASVTITIATPGSMSGTVVSADGTAPEEFRVTVTDRKTGFNRQEAFFRVGGAFTMNDLPAGSFAVTADASSGQTQLEVPLADGERKTGVRLELAALVKVRGTVVALDTGKPLAGFVVFAQAVHGGRARGLGQDDHKNVTDANGAFELQGVAAGRVRVTAWAQDWRSATYGTGQIIATLTPVVDAEVPPLRAPRRRVGNDQAGGDLGFTTKQVAPEVEPEDRRFVVAVVRPGGPAAQAGMLVGDEIVTIEGVDVVGVNYGLARDLQTVPEGTTVVFGVKRPGAPAPVTLKVVAGKPSDG